MNNRQERLISFLVVWFTVFSCCCGYAQAVPERGMKRDYQHLKLPGSPIPDAENLTVSRLPEVTLNRTVKSIIYNSLQAVNARETDVYRQPADLYYLQSGFMCKREWEFEKTTHIPFRFRLGSLADCNALEGKR